MAGKRIMELFSMGRDRQRPESRAYPDLEFHFGSLQVKGEPEQPMEEDPPNYYASTKIYESRNLDVDADLVLLTAGKPASRAELVANSLNFQDQYNGPYVLKPMAIYMFADLISRGIERTRSGGFVITSSVNETYSWLLHTEYGLTLPIDHSTSFTWNSRGTKVHGTFKMSVRATRVPGISYPPNPIGPYATYLDLSGVRYERIDKTSVLLSMKQ